MFLCYYFFVHYQRELFSVSYFMNSEPKFVYRREKEGLGGGGENTYIADNETLRENCLNTELFLVRIALYSDWINEPWRMLSTKCSCIFRDIELKVFIAHCEETSQLLTPGKLPKGPWNEWNSGKPVKSLRIYKKRISVIWDNLLL